MVIAYVLYFPPTILLVIPNLIFPKNESSSSDHHKDVAVNTFNVSANIVPLVISLCSLSTRQTSLLASLTQVSGLILCYLNLMYQCHWIISALGLGLLAGAGSGLTLTNNIIITKKVYEEKVSFVFGKHLYFELKLYIKSCV